MFLKQSGKVLAYLFLEKEYSGRVGRYHSEMGEQANKNTLDLYEKNCRESKTVPLNNIKIGYFKIYSSMYNITKSSQADIRNSLCYLLITK